MWGEYMGEMNTAAISANELVLIMSSIGVLGVIGGWIGEPYHK